jgi:hypothetical protein
MPVVGFLGTILTELPYAVLIVGLLVLLAVGFLELAL